MHWIVDGCKRFASACCFWSLMSCWLVAAEFQLGDALEPSDTIQRMTVSVTIGSDGGDLCEPVALDLGLGFPFWLHPLGREATDIIPFGAVPTESSAEQTLPAGGSATFTFTLDGDTAVDRFRTSAQLLQGVQISDIARIGFIGAGQNDWTLQSYEIRINDKLFASADQINQRSLQQLENVRFEIADLNLQLAPLTSKRDDLHALAEAQLATEADLQTLAELDKQLRPLRHRLRWLNGQVAGQYPWYMEEAFDPSWRAESSVESVSITLLTASHPGADTRNSIYFRTGGHKFLLADWDDPLTPTAAPQTFELDLLSGPLSAADFRGNFLGTLASAQPYGKTPDRWHPLRLIVAVNDVVTYDSEDYPFDRKSLDTIRLIPPAHLDNAGQLVLNNNRSLREIYVWESGKALGLDPIDGSALPVPEPDAPNAPQPEPGLSDDGPSDGEEGENFAPFPGEGPQSGWDEGWLPGESIPDWPWQPGGLGGWLGLPDWTLPGGGGGGSGGGGGNGAKPPPVGPTFALQNVRVTSGWKTSDPFVIEWDVSGDENEIKEYRVSLHEFRPDAPPYFGLELASTNVGLGARTASLTIAGPITGVHYVLPKVTALPSGQTLNLYFEWGPARPVFPPQADPVKHRPHLFPLTYTYVSNANPNVPQSDIISLGSEPPHGRGVWTFGRQQSHIDFEFDDPSAGGGWNIALRPDANDQQLEFGTVNAFIVVGPPLPSQKYRFLTHAGFINGKDAANTAQVSLPYTLTRVFPPPQLSMLGVMSPVTVTNPASGPPQPMKAVEFEINMANMMPGGYLLQVTARVEGGIVDPQHPLGLFGLRLIPE